MPSSDRPEPGESVRVSDLLTPELAQNFKYIYGRLVAYGRRQGLTLQEAEDLAGDAVLRAWEKRDRFTPRPNVPLVAWLLRLAKNLFIDRLRAAETRRRVAEATRRDQSADRATDLQHSNLMDAEAARRRDLLVLELLDDLRPVFWAWVEQQDRGISRNAAAEQLGMTVEEFDKPPRWGWAHGTAVPAEVELPEWTDHLGNFP